MGSPGWASGPLGLGLTFHACETKAFHKVDLVKVAQSCPTLCSSMDCSPPGSSVPGILQARTLWGGGGGVISTTRGSSQPRGQTRVSCTAGSFFTTGASREALS